MRPHNRHGHHRENVCPSKRPWDQLSFLTSTRLRNFGSIDREVRTIHAAKITSAAFFRMHHVRWMVAFRIKSGRERQNVRGTKLHAKTTGFAALNDDRNTSFCHKIPEPRSDPPGYSTAQDVIMCGKLARWC